MQTYFFVLAFSTLILSVINVQAQTKVCLDSEPPGLEGISHQCLGCICEASTNCDIRATRCISGGAFCGPFLVSRGFWKDAGSCGSSFQNCANDFACAGKILRSYYNAFSKDCDGDQRITCDDYAMMHKNGGYNCGNSLASTKYWQQYLACKTQISNTEGINL